MSVNVMMPTKRKRESANKSESPTGMVLIPAGTFLMGSESGGEYERPVHEVYLDAFLMDETLVTNEQFADFVEDTGYDTEAELAGGAWGYRDGQFSLIPGLSWRNYAAPGREKHPVALVSWNDAQAFARWAGKRLPTEAEWEKAARGGLVGKLYPWGDEAPNGTQSNFAKSPSEIPPTTPVKQFTPNGYGLYDMVGNAWQWCEDLHGEHYYSESPSKNPVGPQTGRYRVRRGGSWNVIQPFRLRTANRGAMDPQSFVPNVGFRCAKSK